ncbi:MAG: hypothetical protein JWR18_1151 [Segetibacter sp.]|nr:hypothetical protein [Segetibacter sp.]
MVYSRSTLNELISTLFYEKFDKYLTITDQQKFLESYINLAKDVKVTALLSECRDVKDNNFLELAVEGGADFIITGDKDLLVLHPFRNVSMITPSSFLQMFEGK